VRTIGTSLNYIKVDASADVSEEWELRRNVLGVVYTYDVKCHERLDNSTQQVVLSAKEARM